MSVIAAIARNNQQRRGGHSYKDKDEKKEECKKGQRGEDSVLAQISVLVVRTFASEERRILLKGFPSNKIVKRCHHREHLRSPKWRKGKR